MMDVTSIFQCAVEFDLRCKDNGKEEGPGYAGSTTSEPRGGKEQQRRTKNGTRTRMKEVDFLTH